MSSKTEGSPNTEKALQIPRAQVVRRMSWIGAIFDFFFGWMWKKSPACQAIEPQAEQKALPTGQPLRTPAQANAIKEGKRLLTVVQGHPTSGCTHSEECNAAQDLRAFMGRNGLTADDLEISVPELRSSIRRVPIAHTKGYMERALRGEFGRYSYQDLSRRMREDQLTPQELCATTQQIIAVERAESIDICASLLSGLRSGATTLYTLRAAMTRRGITAEDLKTTEREFELY